MFSLWLGFHLYFPSCKDGLRSCIVVFFRVRQSTSHWLHQFVWCHPPYSFEVYTSSHPLFNRHSAERCVSRVLKLDGFLSHWSMIWGEHQFVGAGLCDITNCLNVNNDLATYIRVMWKPETSTTCALNPAILKQIYLYIMNRCGGVNADIFKCMHLPTTYILCPLLLMCWWCPQHW